MRRHEHHWLLPLLPFVLLAPSLPACSKAATSDTTPPVTSAAEPVSDAPAAPDEPDPDEPDPAEPEPAEPAPTGTWIDPLPPLSLARLTDEQVARSNGCIEAHDVRSPSTTPAELMAAADCLSAIPVPGHEIRLYQHLLSTAPTAPEALEASRRLGTRFEQVDVRDRAVETYERYLQRYPMQADARALGQRAVCLARSLGLQARVDALLSDLERLYGRRGFTPPSDAELEALCAPLAPLAPRPG
jgi:hypothetical protein